MNCNVCLERFHASERRPKMLPCGHTCCLPCLQALPRKECPECRKVFQGTENLPDNFIVLQISDRPAKAAPRFWCQDCKLEATDLCEDEHSVCSLKKARKQRAQPCLDALQGDGAALTDLRALLDTAVGDLKPQVAACHAKVDARQAAIDKVKLNIQAALKADEADFKAAMAAAAGEGSLPRDAARLLAALADPASECSVALETPGGAWRGSVRPREDAAARLLLCRLLCDGRLEPPAHAQEGGQQDLQQQQGAAAQRNAREFTIPAEVPRWQERSNDDGAGRRSADEMMAARMVVGSRVVRGRDWDSSWQEDGTPPGPGTVTKVGPGIPTVKWDLTGEETFYYMGNGNKYHLKFLASTSEVTLPADIQIGTPAFLDLDEVSSSSDIDTKSKLLASAKLSKARALVGLHCDVIPTWSGLVLEKAAANLEVLHLQNADTEHLQVVARMPRLHSLHLDSVTTATLRLALSVPSLRRLEVHCSPDAPLVAGQGGQGLRLPVAPALEWLRVGVYPLAAALAVTRAHAATLRELELVAASDQPYGCPDLAKELADCGLRKLEKLVLRRYSPTHFCRHEVDLCKKQKMQLWDLFLRSKQNVSILCSTCDKV